MHRIQQGPYCTHATHSEGHRVGISDIYARIENSDSISLQNTPVRLWNWRFDGPDIGLKVTQPITSEVVATFDAQ